MRAPAIVDTRSKYPEKHSVTLVTNEAFFCEGMALSSFHLVCYVNHRVRKSFHYGSPFVEVLDCDIDRAVFQA